jgi:hypothetical protein
MGLVVLTRSRGGLSWFHPFQDYALHRWREYPIYVFQSLGEWSGSEHVTDVSM